jgi:alpha-L-rhamnosidase
VMPILIPGLCHGAGSSNRLAAVVHEDVVSRADHFSVGSVGAKHLLPQLSAHGLHDDAMAIATQTTFPSFGYWLSQVGGASLDR